MVYLMHLVDMIIFTPILSFIAFILFSIWSISTMLKALSLSGEELEDFKILVRAGKQEKKLIVIKRLGFILLITAILNYIIFI